MHPIVWVIIEMVSNTVLFIVVLVASIVYNITIFHNNFEFFYTVSIGKYEIEFNVSRRLTKDEWSYLQVSLTDDSLDSIIEIAVSVSSGQTLLYVSDLIIPSEAVSCAKINTTTNGRTYISPRTLNLHSNKLYIGVFGKKDVENSFTVSVAKINLKGSNHINSNKCNYSFNVICVFSLT